MKKYVLLGLFTLLFFVGFIGYQLLIFQDGKLHITICDVGQGDAVVIRTPGGEMIIFDGGPDSKVLGCLSRAMPFWQREIGLVILSHPHADHLNGLVDVFKKFRVKQFATEDLANTSDGYKALEVAVKKEGIPWQALVNSDKIRTAYGVNLYVVGPTEEYVKHTAMKGGFISSSEFASLEILLSYKDFSMLLTGDSQSKQLADAIASHRNELSGITVLQQPHHGSKTGVTPEIIASLAPKLVTISVGADNKYGHPAPNVMSILQNAHIEVHRTDKEGDLRLVSDGASYNLQ